MQSGLVSHPCVVDKNSGGMSWEQGVPASNQALTPRILVRKIRPTISGYKNQEGYLKREECKSQPRTQSPGFQCQEISPHNFKQKQVGMSQWKKLLESQAVPLKEPTHGLTYLDSLPLSSSTRVTPGGTPVAYGEKLKCLASRRAEGIIHCLNSPHTEVASWCISETPSAWLTLFDLSGGPQRLCPTQLMGPPKLLFHINVLAPALYLPKSSQISNSWPQ